MNYSKDFSVIIPHRDSISTLKKLLKSIPVSDRIEVIVVDNSPTPINKESIDINREFLLLYSEPTRGAGGARNVGIDKAIGKWLLFADADDYYTADAFDVFYSQVNVDAEIVFFGMGGIYIDTGERSDRGDTYTKLVRNFLEDEENETNIRLNFSSPCSKIIAIELINRHHIRFDEVVASNDVYFSLLTGFYAKTISAVDKIVYIATVSKGSLTRRRDYEVVKSRFIVSLRYNKFLKEHGHSGYQKSIMFFFTQSINFGLSKVLEFIKLLILYKQNPFIGYKRWFKTYKSGKQRNKTEGKYITY